MWLCIFRLVLSVGLIDLFYSSDFLQLLLHSHMLCKGKACARNTCITVLLLFVLGKWFHCPLLFVLGKWFVSTGKDNLLNAWRTPYGASIFQVYFVIVYWYGFCLQLLTFCTSHKRLFFIQEYNGACKSDNNQWKCGYSNTSQCFFLFFFL